MATTKKVRSLKTRTTAPAPAKFTIPGPDDLNEPSDSFHDYIVLIFGKKGVGKSTLAAQFPGALHFMWERGRKNLKIRQIPRRRPDGSLDPHLVWNEMDAKGTPFKPLLEQALEDDTVRTVVVDTGDRCYEGALDFVCWSNGCSYPEGEESYKMWDTIKAEFEETLGAVADAGKQLVILSHAREKEIISHFGEPFTVIQPTMSPAAWKLVQTQADFVFYMDWYNTRRALQVRGTDLITASNQVEGHFLDPKGEPLTVIDLGETPAQSYRALIDAFDNKVYDITYTPEPKEIVKKIKRKV